MGVFGDINEATVMGNMTQDPEVRYTSGGNAVTNFSIATNRSYRKQGSDEWTEEVTFHNIVVWGNDAEFLSQKAKKGTRVYVKGRLQTRSWDDSDGKKNYRTEIIAEKVILIDRYEKGPAAGGTGGNGAPKAEVSSAQASTQSPAPAKQSKKASSKSTSDEIDPDDLPF